MSTPGDKPNCPDCGNIMVWENKKPLTKTSLYRWRCGRCRYLAHAHKLTAQQWQDLVAAQDGKCAICGVAETLVVDHDHSCCPAGKSCPECRRGLLCNTCNRFLGLAKDDVRRLIAASYYLMVNDNR